ncbi:MAG TPA: hypothetical protein V6C72_05540 [Chroococcales cyanobacterium]
MLKRKPRTALEKGAVLLAVLGVGAALLLGAQITTTYWHAANSPALRTDLVWDEDREPPAAQAVETAEAQLNESVHYHKAKALIESGAPPEEVHQYLEGGINTLMEQKQFKLAAKLLSFAAQYAIKVNGEQSIQPVSLQKNLVECLWRARDYAGAAQASQTLLRITAFMGPDDRAPFALQMANAYYMQSKWNDAAEAYATYFQLHFKHRSGKPESQESRHSADVAMAVSRMATCHRHLADKAQKSELFSEATKYRKSSAREFTEAYERWKLIKGETTGNTVVALVNSLHERHLLDKSENLDDQYSQAIHDTESQFGDNSAYYAVALMNYSDYLLDKGNLFGGMSARLNSWKILSSQKIS